MSHSKPTASPLLYNSLAVLFLLLFLQPMPATAQSNRSIDHSLDSTLRIQYFEIQNLKTRIVRYNRQDSIRRAELLAVFNAMGFNLQNDALLEMRMDSLDREKAVYIEHMEEKIDSIRENARGAPVMLAGDTIFLVYSPLGPMGPSERAWNTNKRIDGLFEENLVSIDNINVQSGAESVDILYRDIVLHRVVDSDAEWIGVESELLADNYAVELRSAMEVYNQRTGTLRVLKQVGLVIAVILVLILIITLLNRGFNKLFVWLMARSSKLLSKVHFENYQFLNEAQTAKVLRWFLNILKWPIILIILYIVLPVMFSIFPETRDISVRLINLVLDPVKNFIQGFFEYIPEMITIVVIIVLARYFVRMMKFFAGEIENGKLKLPGFYPDWAMPTFNLLKLVVYAFTFIMIFPLLPGSHSPVFKGVSIFFGVLVSLGSSSAIGNMIAGLVITYMRAFKIGDRIKIGETVGTVVEKTMLVTRLRTIKNEEVTIPNSTILASSTINYSTASEEHGLILHTSVTIGYDVPWRQIYDLLITAAQKTDHILDKPKPFVLQTSLDDFYVSYQLNAYTAKPELSAIIYSVLHGNIQDNFRDAGVEIMSPHYRAERDGSDITIPPADAPKVAVPPEKREDADGQSKGE